MLSENILKDLLAKLSSENDDAVANAYDSLPQVGSEIVPALLPLVNDTTTPLTQRFAVINLLVELQDARLIPVFSQALQDSNKNIRQSISYKLSIIHVPVSYFADFRRLLDSSYREARLCAVKVLQRMPLTPEAKNQLVEKLHLVFQNDSSLEVRQAAIQALAKLGNSNTCTLFRAALQPSLQLQEALVYALGELKDKEAVLPLIALYKQSYAEADSLKIAILYSLGQLGGEAAYNFVSNLLNTPISSNSLKSKIVTSLGSMAMPTALEKLLTLANDADELVASAAVYSLGFLPAETVFDTLVSYLTKPRFLVQLSAVKALGNLRDPRVFEVLLRHLPHPSADFRYELALAFGKLGDKKALPILEKLATDFTEISLLQAGITVAEGAQEAIAAINDNSDSRAEDFFIF